MGRFSPEVWVLFQPARAFRTLAARPDGPARGLAWRRPLFFAFLLGCTMSLTTTGSLTMRLVASTAISWSFIPAIEIGALALALRGAGERHQRTHLIDLFFTGLGAWSIWLIGVCIIFTSAPPALVFPLFSKWLDAVGLVVLAWSAYVDYCFFRDGLGRSPALARRGLLLHRLMSWIPIGLVISQPAILPTILYFTGR